MFNVKEAENRAYKAKKENPQNPRCEMEIPGLATLILAQKRGLRQQETPVFELKTQNARAFSGENRIKRNE